MYENLFQIVVASYLFYVAHIIQGMNKRTVFIFNIIPFGMGLKMIYNVW
jgi:hypothetical protein